MFQLTSTGGRNRDQTDAASRRRLETDERQPSCFAFEEELGEQWNGYGAMTPLINDLKLTL